MRFYPFSLLALIASTSAYYIPQGQNSSCPKVWSEVVKELQPVFDGCGRDAHGAIRAPFHDCVNNGCDGSLILSDECSRAENAGLSSICGKLLGWTTKYNVSAADMIQFAAATAIAACPLGPTVRALVGRTDSSVAADLHSMPSTKDSVDKILSAFAAKGFSAQDVVALMGTHSIAVQVNDDPSQAGKSLDSTPSVYDTKFYTETKDGTAPYSLQSDKLLSNDTKTALAWADFGDSLDAWDRAFVDAWNRFAVVGNDVGSLQDCSSLITIRAPKVRRAVSASFAPRACGRFGSR